MNADGKYELVPVARSEGDVQMAVTKYGNPRVSMVDATTGLDLSASDPVQTYVSNSFQNVAAGTATTVVKSGAGTLGSVTINTKGASSNTLTLYDNTAGSGTKIATIDTTAAQVTLNFNCAFATGLTCVSATGTGADYTVTYR